MEVIAVHPRNTAMAVAHVFAYTNVRYHDEPGTLRLDRANSCLHDALFGIGATRGFIFFARNSEKKNGLQPQIESTLCFVSDFVDRELENAWHAFDRLPRLEFLADEQRQNEIMRGEFSLANEIPDAFAASQSPRPVDQFSHDPRLPVWFCRRKFAELDAV